MTRDNAAKLLLIISAYAEGKTIQTNSFRTWSDIDSPSFDGPAEGYRIKPEPKYRPFTYDEFFYLMFKKRIWIKRDDVITSDYTLSTNSIIIEKSYYSFEECKEVFTLVFEDGTETPFGVLE